MTDILRQTDTIGLNHYSLLTEKMSCSTRAVDGGEGTLEVELSRRGG